MEKMKRIGQNKLLLVLLLLVIGIAVGWLMTKKQSVLNLGILLLFVVANKQIACKKNSK
ncbi:hypothetical protein [Candidatus Enterococcus ferrettii]|uniref:Uncharacterized protein n=1 Tax=Candidatus Enterococcus ferrettii TaxID=2815324 RepID=A0ABV0EY73_9ENTE|nr:hypothetical protein [Enterococcus sp. 665A]MBO1338671.1 hypothetical protein [Enterococcus sp. 665A]